MKLHLDKSCKTCECNINNICTNKYYGRKTPVYIDENCDCWDIGFEYYSKIMNSLPWYLNKLRIIKNDYEILDLVELDEKNFPIKLNIFDVIENIYGLKYPFAFAYLLDVSESVIAYAHNRSVPNKRINHFSETFCIPSKYFYDVSTQDFETIEKCKACFLKKQNKSIQEINERALKIYFDNQEKIEKLENKKNYTKYLKEFNYKLNHFKTLSSFNNDLSDDFKSRDYVVEILLQKDEYKGHIYYEYNYNKFGLDNFIINSIINFIDSLDSETIIYNNETLYLINDISLDANIANNTISFVLSSNAGKTIHIRINSGELINYVVGYRIIECNGHGKKKETRKCCKCNYFKAYENSYRGLCEFGNKEIYGSKIICPEFEDLNAKLNK